MKTYVVTGGTTGIGAAICAALRAQGATVINIDMQGGDIQADLSTPAGRESAIAAVQDRCTDGIDGFVPCAGLGPQHSDWARIIAVNYFAVRVMTEALQPLLLRRTGTTVLIASNSAGLPGLDQELVKLMARQNDEAAAMAYVKGKDGHQAYAGSKCALVRWMRRITPAWAGQGLRINAVAPGATMTPLLQGGLDHPVWGDAIRNFKVPLGGDFGKPEQIADAVLFMLGGQSSFCTGSVLFVDGGTDALLRPDSF